MCRHDDRARPSSRPGWPGSCRDKTESIDEVRLTPTNLADIDENAGRQTVDLAAKKGVAAVFARCDVTKTEDLAGAFECTVEHFGQLHIAFNNAGIGGEDLFADDPGDWARIIDVDLTAVIDATRLADRSVSNGEPPVYAAAKAGVVNFSRSLAYLAEESNIRVNAICPELVDTSMALGLGEERLAGGILRPEDIAAGVVELIEDDSRAGAVMCITVRDGREYVTT